jgi:hypothetical protein
MSENLGQFVMSASTLHTRLWGTVSRRFQRAPILTHRCGSPAPRLRLGMSPYGRGGETRVCASRRQRSHHKEKAGFESIAGADCGVVVFIIRYAAEATNLPLLSDALIITREFVENGHC